jgi:hypothetical protein
MEHAQPLSRRSALSNGLRLAYERREMNLLVLLENRYQTSATEHLGQWAETEFAIAKPERLGAAPVCESCNGPLGKLEWLPPFRVELSVPGKDFGDIAFGAGDDLVVSTRFIDVMSRAGIVGLETKEAVTLVRVVHRGKPIRDRPMYLRVRVPRPVVYVDDQQSEIVRKSAASVSFCPGCRNGWQGIRRGKRIVLAAGSIPKLDLFRARNLPGKILCSERFATACLEAKLKNAVFVPADRFSWDHYPWEIRD